MSYNLCILFILSLYVEVYVEMQQIAVFVCLFKNAPTLAIKRKTTISLSSQLCVPVLLMYAFSLSLQLAYKPTKKTSYSKHLT